MSVQGPACVTFSHGLGQNRKSSIRAHVFRFAPKSGHCATESACPFRAISGFTMGSGRSPVGRPNFFDDSFHVVVIRDAQEMYVLALVTQKGGSGKSTLAVGIAVEAMRNGERVAIVDGDRSTRHEFKMERTAAPYLSARRSGNRFRR